MNADIMDHHATSQYKHMMQYTFRKLISNVYQVVYFP